ncbi:MAG TPA: energy transducer TonB [Acetobacteraceae bacterium]|nr:energy transducer TonB [Acetobacteraceae bacterium]
MTTYIDQDRPALGRLLGLGTVVLLHGVLIYALVNGLGQRLVQKISAPIETRIIQEVKPPPPEAAPPPPPLAAAPPPYIPPPEIQVQQPPPQHAVTAFTHAAPPAPVAFRPAQPAPVAAAIPDHAFSARAISGGTPAYPEDYADTPRPGSVTVSCVIETDGRPDQCRVLSTEGGAAFARATMRWLNSGEVRYSPAVHNGQAVREEHTWVVQFEAE